MNRQDMLMFILADDKLQSNNTYSEDSTVGSNDDSQTEQVVEVENRGSDNTKELNDIKNEIKNLQDQQTQSSPVVIDEGQNPESDNGNESLTTGPVLPDQKIEEPYQTATVPNNGTQVDVLELSIDTGKAAVIQQIGNDWFPGMEFEIRIDEVRVEKNIQRQVAPTNNPQEIEILAKSDVKWTAINEGKEDRTVAAVADGIYVPESVYDKKVQKYYDDMGY